MVENNSGDTPQSKQPPHRPESRSDAAPGKFAIHKIYMKDISFETPNSPDIFQVDWKPDVDFRILNDAERLAPGTFDVFVRITVTVRIEDKTAFLVEVTQAGIFGIDGLPEERLGYMLGSFCPNILFPYAREAVSDLVVRGGFPQLLLAPVNFDALYAKHLQEEPAQGKGPAGASAPTPPGR